MSDLQTILDESVTAGVAPHLAGGIASADGTLWLGQSGIDGEPIYRIYSMTKLVGSIGAVILSERGRLDYDQPVAELLPRFARLPVLEGFAGDQPVLVPQKRTATIADLARHTSGLAYGSWHADLDRYFAATGAPQPFECSRAGFEPPLVFQPGTAWAYGLGIDWLGMAIEAIDGRALPQFFAEEVFEPLGLRDTTFALSADQEARLAPGYLRGRDGAFKPRDIRPPSAPEVWSMGLALYSTPSDFLRLVQVLLSRGAPLLTAESCARMLSNAIGALRVPRMDPATFGSEPIDLYPGLEKTHSLAAMRLEEDHPGGRRAGTAFWAGIQNTHWWADPTAGLGGVFMTQTLPFAEAPILAAMDRFEKAAYARFS
ncbi:MAG: serine hydrolase domain-containing protein [Pseudomonadota bacterium]